MKVEIKKSVTVKEHGLRARAGEQIHVSRNEALELIRRGLALDPDAKVKADDPKVEEQEPDAEVEAEVIEPPVEPKKARKSRKNAKSVN